MSFLSAIFGGGNKSQATTTSTANNNYDQRQVNDAGGGVVGTGNWLDKSSNLSSDSHNINVSTDGGAFDVVRSLADGLNRIGLAQVDAAGDIARRADASSSSAMSFAMRAQSDAASFNENNANRAFDLARSSAAQAFASSGDALGFTRDTFHDVVSLASKTLDQAADQAKTAATTAAGAYASAADTSTGNKTLIYAGVAAVALVGVVVAFRAFKG